MMIYMKYQNEKRTLNDTTMDFNVSLFNDTGDQLADGIQVGYFSIQDKENKVIKLHNEQLQFSLELFSRGEPLKEQNEQYEFVRDENGSSILGRKGKEYDEVIGFNQNEMMAIVNWMNNDNDAILIIFERPNGGIH